MRVIPYEKLEERAFDSGKLKVIFNESDKIVLRRGVIRETPVIELLMPRGNIYPLGKYKIEEDSKRAFQEFASKLERGCSIRITGNSSAKIM